MKLSKTNRIRSTNFKNAWYEAIKFVLLDGVKLTFGSRNEPKKCLDSVQEIILTRHALRQIEDHVVHPQYKFGGKRLEEYCKEFTDTFLEDYTEKRENEKFDYLYYERLTRKPDQIYEMYVGLEYQIDSKIASNFCQATPWEIRKDGTYKKSSPCLQRIWLRWYEPNIIDVHLSWR